MNKLTGNPHHFGMIINPYIKDKEIHFKILKISDLTEEEKILLNIRETDFSFERVLKELGKDWVVKMNKWSMQVIKDEQNRSI